MSTLMRNIARAIAALSCWENAARKPQSDKPLIPGSTEIDGSLLTRPSPVEASQIVMDDEYLEARFSGPMTREIASDCTHSGAEVSGGGKCFHRVMLPLRRGSQCRGKDFGQKRYCRDWSFLVKDPGLLDLESSDDDYEHDQYYDCDDYYDAK